MKKSINQLVIFSLLMVLLAGTQAAVAQEYFKDDIRVALKSGSSKDIVRYFNDIIELKIDGKEGSYSRAQSEFVLKDFFRKYPSAQFEYNHHGESPGGARYSIGTYQFDGGSFRVYMKLKKVKIQGKETYLIDTLDFSRE